MNAEARRLVTLLERAGASLGDPEEIGAPAARARVMERRSALDGARRVIYSRARRVGDLAAKLGVVQAEVAGWDKLAARLAARLDEARAAPGSDDWATRRVQLLVVERLEESLALLERGWGRRFGDGVFLPEELAAEFAAVFPDGNILRHTSPPAVRARTVSLAAEVEEAEAELANAMVSGEALLASAVAEAEAEAA